MAHGMIRGDLLSLQKPFESFPHSPGLYDAQRLTQQSRAADTGTQAYRHSQTMAHTGESMMQQTPDQAVHSAHFSAVSQSARAAPEVPLEPVDARGAAHRRELAAMQLYQVANERI